MLHGQRAGRRRLLQRAGQGVQRARVPVRPRRYAQRHAAVYRRFLKYRAIEMYNFNPRVHLSMTMDVSQSQRKLFCNIGFKNEL